MSLLTNPSKIMSFILGNESKSNIFIKNNKNQLNTENNKQTNLRSNPYKITRSLILSSAMFWSSKTLIQKIKTLFLNNSDLIEFDNTEDFKIEQLETIQLLSLSKNSIIHLQPISCLETLLSLNISHNKVYDLNPLTSLSKLEELYASYNQIKNIEALATLAQLKKIILYKNLIMPNKKQETYLTLGNLKKLQEIDLEENQICDEGYVELLRTLDWIKKINGELTRNTQKIKEMSSSKGFGASSMKSFNNTSVLFNNNQSTFLDTKATFYNFSKKSQSLLQSSTSTLQEKQNILRKLEIAYSELDEEFEHEIIDNVQLKSKLYKMIENKKNTQLKQEDNTYKNEQIKNMKRKVKSMKEQLFTKDKKGELLRKLFEFEIIVKRKKEEKQSIDTQNEQTKKLRKNKETSANLTQWTRRFEADEVIVIEQNQKYLQEEDEEINDLLSNFEDTLKDIKSQIDYFS